VEGRRGPTIPRIARAYPMRMPRCPTATEATCAKTCNPAELRERRNLEVLPPRHPGRAEKAERAARNEWAIGRSRRAHPRRAGALSAVFGMAVRRGRIATTDIRALALRGAEAEDSAGVAVVAAGTVVVDIDRSENNHGENQIY
jgi:hypothetical protein